MKKIVFALATLSLLAVTAFAANAASNCTTTCNRNALTGQQTCNTYCY